jgi:hypothetical protein
MHRVQSSNTEIRPDISSGNGLPVDWEKTAMQRDNV